MCACLLVKLRKNAKKMFIEQLTCNHTNIIVIIIFIDRTNTN